MKHLGKVKEVGHPSLSVGPSEVPRNSLGFSEEFSQSHVYSLLPPSLVVFSESTDPLVPLGRFVLPELKILARHAE